MACNVCPQYMERWYPKRQPLSLTVRSTDCRLLSAHSLTIALRGSRPFREIVDSFV